MIPPRKLLASSLIILISVAAEAGPGYTLGQPQTNGAGCPVGSVATTVAPDGSSFSILFDSYILTVGPGQHNPADVAKVCKFRVPIQLPPGFTVETTRIDYRGFSQTSRASAWISTSGPILQLGVHTIGNQPIRTLVTKSPGDFFVRQQIEQNFNGQCKEIKFIEFTTTLQIQGLVPRNPAFLLDQSTIGMDSVDGGGTGEDGITLGIRVKKCN